MVDRELRQSERRALLDEEDRRRWLTRAVRSGRLSERDLNLLARLREPACQGLIDNAPHAVYDIDDLARQLSDHDPATLAWAVLEAAGTVRRFWVSDDGVGETAYRSACQLFQNCQSRSDDPDSWSEELEKAGAQRLATLTLASRLSRQAASVRESIETTPGEASELLVEEFRDALCAVLGAVVSGITIQFMNHHALLVLDKDPGPGSRYFHARLVFSFVTRLYAKRAR